MLHVPSQIVKIETTSDGAMQTRRDSKPLVEEKMQERQHQPVVVLYDDQPTIA